MRHILPHALILRADLAAGALGTACKQRELSPAEFSAPQQDSLLAKASMMRWIALHPQRSLQEALELADASTTSNRTRGTAPSRAYEVQFILRGNLPTATRGARHNHDVDTLLYILNSPSGQGSTLIAGDRRVGDILAILDSGNFSDTSALRLSGISVFLSRLPAYFAQQRASFEEALNAQNEPIRWDSVPHTPHPKPKPFKKISCGPWKTASQVHPLSPVCWAQGYPYNNDAPIISGKHAAAGCVATATAQIAATYYARHPTGSWALGLNWRLLTLARDSSFVRLKLREQHCPNVKATMQVYYADIARLFRTIGDGVHMDWGVKQSGAKTADAVTFLNNQLGIPYSSLDDYNCNCVISSLAKRHPALMSGFDTKIETKHGFWFITWTETSYAGGHTWVVDGYLEQQRTIAFIGYDGEVVRRSTQKQRFLHCNWGWNGWHNGYFVAGVFDSNHPAIGDGTLSTDPLNFRYNLQCSLHQ